MSLVYAKKSDEIGGMFRVCFACFPTVACGIEILDVLDIRFEWLRLYESLLTYVAHMDLI